MKKKNKVIIASVVALALVGSVGLSLGLRSEETVAGNNSEIEIISNKVAEVKDLILMGDEVKDSGNHEEALTYYETALMDLEGLETEAVALEIEENKEEVNTFGIEEIKSLKEELEKKIEDTKSLITYGSAQSSEQLVNEEKTEENKTSSDDVANGDEEGTNNDNANDSTSNSTSSNNTSSENNNTNNGVNNSNGSTSNNNGSNNSSNNDSTNNTTSNNNTSSGTSNSTNTNNKPNIPNNSNNANGSTTPPTNNSTPIESKPVETPSANTSMSDDEFWANIPTVETDPAYLGGMEEAHFELTGEIIGH